MINRVGFACKYMHNERTLKPKLLKEAEQPFNYRATTIKWLNENATSAEERLNDLVRHNLSATKRLIEYVGSLPESQRMVRLGSDMLPAYTESKWGGFYDNNIKAFIAQELGRIGELARSRGVRLSMHPGQFTVLASDNPTIVENSIREFEYHVDIARWMGYGKSFQDFKINVHISGAQGPAGIRNALSRMSPEARNTLTIENEEYKWGLNECLDLANDCALVLDIHHAWINEGRYIQPTDDRFKRVIDSWRGVRPTIHYSVSREDVLVDHPTDVLPDMEQLLAQGYKKGKLRAHSDAMWNTAVNEWAASFRPYADIMVEAKNKNLASIPFEEQSRT